MSMGLTPLQLRCLNFLKDYIADRGVAPTITEIMDALGQSSRSAAHRVVTALEERGHIRRMPYKVRAIEVISELEAPFAPGSVVNNVRDWILSATTVAVREKRARDIQDMAATIAAREAA